MNKLRSWLIRKLGGTEKSLPVLSFKERPILTSQPAEIKTLAATAFVELESTSDKDTDLEQVKPMLVKELANEILKSGLVTVYSQVDIDKCWREYLAEIQIVVPNKK